MADNYLEKQYERYQARKAAWELAKKRGKSKPKTHTRETDKNKPENEKL